MLLDCSVQEARLAYRTLHFGEQLLLFTVVMHLQDIVPAKSILDEVGVVTVQNQGCLPVYAIVSSEHQVVDHCHVRRYKI